MTQAVNLANFSNSLDSSGQVSPSVLNAAVPYSKGGTNATTQATAQANMGVMTGEIKMWGTASAPTGYLLCNGTAVSRSTYAALFAVYGSTFGAGDGSTTFNLPDFRDRMPIGAGSTYALATTGGSASTTLITANLPSHNHTATSTTTVTDPGHFHISGVPSDYASPDYGSGSISNTNQKAGSSTTSNSPLTQTKTTGITASTTTTTANTGSGTAVTTISPYLGIYYIIKT
jgi:microcystin-dependent protein